jgi:hypothetical protein
VPVGFLRNLEVVAGGIAFSIRRALVGSDVAEAFGDRLLMDFGRAFVRSGRLIVAEQFAAVRLPVALVGGRSSSSARRAASAPADSSMTRQ